MYDAMREALETADASAEVGAIVFAGLPGAFSAGNDIADFAASAAKAFSEMPALQFIRQLAGTRTPMVAAVDGIAVGIGTTLTLHCDLVYASPAARFRMPFVELALVPEAASSYLLPRRVGRLKATEMLLLSEAFDADAALSLGLVNAVIPSDMLVEHAMAQAARLAALPRGAVKATRALIRGDQAEVEAALGGRGEGLRRAPALGRGAGAVRRVPLPLPKPAASDVTEQKPLSNKICLVAGASRGVGRGIARGLGEAGATVIVTARSSETGPRTEMRPEAIEDTAREVDAAGGEGHHYLCDHTSERAVDELVHWALRRFGRLDVVVSSVWGGNEGYDGERYPDGSTWGTPFWRRSAEPFGAFLQSGPYAGLLLARAVAPAMVAQKSRAAGLRLLRHGGGLSRRYFL